MRIVPVFVRLSKDKFIKRVACQQCLWSSGMLGHDQVNSRSVEISLHTVGHNAQTQQVSAAVILWTCIRELPASNLGRFTIGVSISWK
jgi:hypothetical protein